MKASSEAPAKASLIQIDADSAGQRIDNFLFARLKGVPKSHIYRILRSGEVRVNGGRSQPKRRLDAGDVIRIPPLRVAEPARIRVSPELVRSRLDHCLLYEDDDLLVLNKPAGMAVHGGSGLSFGLIEGLRILRPEARFLELVHRLDRDTSGCLLIAKKRSALRILHDMFRDERQVHKHYLALLSGVWARKQMVVNAPLKKNVLQSGERMVRVSPDGKPAQTEFRRLRAYAEATLVEAKLLTGRTHQIRVHAQSMGHPIACDERYGHANVNQRFREMGLKRMFLHAASLSFRLPGAKRDVKVEAPLAPELDAFLERLSS